LPGTLDLFVSYYGNNYAIGTFDYPRGVTWLQTTFRPYFYVSVSRSSQKYLVSVLEKKFPKDVVSIEESGLVPLVWMDGAGFVPSPRNHVALKVEVSSPSRVPKVSDFIERNFATGGHVTIGAANVKFDVRCGFDLTRGFLTSKDAIALLPADDIESEAEEVIKLISDLRVTAFDIEVDARGEFPGPDAKVLSVSYATVGLGENLELREVLDRVTVLEGKDLVPQFMDALKEERSQAVVGYNSYAFDVRYLFRNQDSGPTHRFVMDSGGTPIPHFDLFLLLENMRSAMRVRSHGTHALDDVAVESGVVDPSDPFVSEMLAVEEGVDRTRIGLLYERDRETFLKYAKYDVVLTALLARKWLPAVYALAAFAKIPPTMVQFLNAGQIAEYLAGVYWMEKLGFAPAMRRRDPSREFGKVYEKVLKEGEEFYGLGKVYVKRPGVFQDVLELDFNQLYPTIYASRSVDPTGMVRLNDARVPDWLGDAVERLAFTIFLGAPATKSSDVISTITFKGPVAPIYGPVASLLFNLYKMRGVTKALKKKIGEYGDVLDQAVKIFVNSLYGGFSKQVGNLVNEDASAYIFYLSNKILHEVIDFVNTTLSEYLFREYGEWIEVVYGDTDSVFIAGVPKEVAPLVEEAVNSFVKDTFGSLFSMKVEGFFDTMLISHRKYDKDEAAKKSYLLFSKDESGRLRLVDMKGIFYKIDAPEFIRERRGEIYEKVVSEKMDRGELIRYLVELAKDVARSKPQYLFYHKVTAPDFRSEDEPRLKRLNRVEHFIYLYRLHLMGMGKRVEGGLGLPGGRSVVVEFRVPEIEEKSPVVDAYFIPLQTRGTKKFLVYVGEDGGKFVLHRVSTGVIQVLSEQREDGSSEEVGYRASFVVDELRVDIDGLLSAVYPEIEKFANECATYIIAYTRGTDVSWLQHGADGSGGASNGDDGGGDDA